MPLDIRQQHVMKTFTMEELLQMDAEEVSEILGKLSDVRSKIRGTAVVLGPDGKPKYNDPKRAGEFHEDKLPGAKK